MKRAGKQPFGLPKEQYSQVSRKGWGLRADVTLEKLNDECRRCKADEMTRPANLSGKRTEMDDKLPDTCALRRARMVLFPFYPDRGACSAVRFLSEKRGKLT